MPPTERIRDSNEQFISEIEALQAKLAEAERKLAEAQDVIAAIQSGDVDAVVVSGPDGDQVFTLKGAEYAYRVLVEAMHEGAATVGTDGIILYCNQRLSELTGIAMEHIIGSAVTSFISGESARAFDAVLARAISGEPCTTELSLQNTGGEPISVQVSLGRMKSVEPVVLCMVVTDLTELHARDEVIAEGKLSKSIIESAASAIAVCDEDGKVLHGNEPFERLCNCNPLFRQFDEVLPLRTVNGSTGNGGRFSILDVLSGRTFAGQELALHRDNATIALLLSSSPIRNSPLATGCVITLTDITEQKQAEAQLRDSEERFRTLFDLGPVAVYYCDVSGVIENFNRRAVELWGRAPDRADTLERFCGSVKLYRPDGSFLPRERCPMAEVLRNEFPEIHDQEVLLERPDGSRITVVVNIRQLKDQKGQVAGAVNCFYDITDRKLAEHSTARLAAIVECSDDAIVAKDLDGVIQSWNLGAERLFGYAAEEAIGKSITMLIPADRAGEEAHILGSVRRGEHIDHYESVRRHKDGRLLNVSLTISPIISHGKIVGASKIARDISGRKLAEAALLKSEKLVAAGRLAATMAHEINNPLQAITNLVSILANSPSLVPEEQALAKTAEEELGRIAHLTRQSLSFYRDSTSPGAVNLRETVEGVLKIFSNQIKAKEITLEGRSPLDVPAIESFAGEIRQVVTALLLNAIDAVPKGGTIAVHVHKSSRWGKSAVAGVRISIADNGIGVSPTNLGRIFEPFFTTKGEQGTGLGLWVSNGIVNRLGGSIKMRSCDLAGRSGSCFSVFFPIQLPQNQTDIHL